MEYEVKLCRICWAQLCSCVNGSSVACAASRASDLALCQALVHYKVFSAYQWTVKVT